MYERALASDPRRVLAATNLGVIYAQRGMLHKALELWIETFERNPQASEVGVDLGSARQLLKQSATGARCAN